MNKKYGFKRERVIWGIPILHKNFSSKKGKENCRRAGHLELHKVFFNKCVSNRTSSTYTRPLWHFSRPLSPLPLPFVPQQLGFWEILRLPSNDVSSANPKPTGAVARRNYPASSARQLTLFQFPAKSPSSLSQPPSRPDPLTPLVISHPPLSSH